jgi:hypothetical protein
MNNSISLSWKDYEEAVFEEFRRVYHSLDAEIIKNTYINGKYSGAKRQIDVLIKLRKDDVVTSTIIIECKHYCTKINVKVVDSFIGCLTDAGADKGVIVSEKGFTKAAISRAHKGKDDIEVDILCLEELQQFQSQAALPYAGNSALALSAPFGWVIDGTIRGFAPAVLHRRGISFEEATKKEKEWMYVQFFGKQTKIDTLDKLIEAQNESLRVRDGRAIINVAIVDGLKVRQATLPSYPTPEITVFREFDWFIVFVVAYCPECYIDRDIKKVIAMLKDAIPIHVTQ